MNPTFDSDGYPSDETLALISDWYNNNNWEPESFLIFTEAAFNKHYGKWEIIPNYNNDLLKDKPFTALRIATGGWSGNETVISAMKKTVFWSVFWRASVCGGLFILDADKSNV
jgi:hypothetical protein